MPVIEAPARPEDEALALVYAKAARHRGHRRRVGRRIVSGLVAVSAAALVWALVATGPSQHQAVYAVPASLSDAQSHQVLVGLRERYRALGYAGVRTEIGPGTVRVEWDSGSLGTGVAAQLGGSGRLSLRPVLGSHIGPCAPSGPAAALSQPTEDPSPSQPDRCLQLGPAQMSDLAFSSVVPVHQSGGWAVHFTVAPGDVAAFDQVNAANLGHALAIVDDGQILSAPLVHDADFHGQGVISGRFNQATAQALAVELRFGLPATLSVLSVS